MLDATHAKPKRPDTVDFHCRAVERVIATVRDRLDETISLGEMASVAYMSKFHFNRTFREVTGVPPRRFLSALRIEAATRMLLNTDRRVTDICLDVGYSSLGTFIRRFSSVLGISPLKLRLMGQAPVQAFPNEREFDNTALPREAGRSESYVNGRVQAPDSFSGPIFIGLFRTSIPEGSPVACTVCIGSGHFVLGPLRQGNYHLLAMGIPWPATMNDYFSFNSALRGAERISVFDPQTEAGELLLRTPAPTDPPILLSLPTLLAKFSAGGDQRERAL